MAEVGPTPRTRLTELFARLDALFARTAARFPGPSGITCRAGCADCCRRFSVTRLEAEAIAEGLASLPEETRAALAARASQDTDTCPALEADARCVIYAFRPAICRTHGLPIRFSAAGAPVHDGGSAGSAPKPPGRSLPVVDTCPRNFSGRDLDALPPDAVLDQETLSTVIGALDAARADEAGRPRGERVGIAELLTVA
jgi:hypothetical protein